MAQNDIKKMGNSYNQQVNADDEALRQALNNPLGMLQAAPVQNVAQQNILTPDQDMRSRAVLNSMFAQKPIDPSVQMQRAKQADQDKSDEDAMNELNADAAKQDQFQKIRGVLNK